MPIGRAKLIIGIQTLMGTTKSTSKSRIEQEIEDRLEGSRAMLPALALQQGAHSTARTSGLLPILRRWRDRARPRLMASTGSKAVKLQPLVP